MTLTKVLVHLRLAQLVYSPPFFSSWGTMLLLVRVAGSIFLQTYFNAKDQVNALKSLLKRFTRRSILPLVSLKGGF